MCLFPFTRMFGLVQPNRPIVFVFVASAICIGPVSVVIISFASFIFTASSFRLYFLHQFSIRVSFWNGLMRRSVFSFSAFVPITAILYCFFSFRRDLMSSCQFSIDHCFAIHCACGLRRMYFVSFCLVFSFAVGIDIFG